MHFFTSEKRRKKINIWFQYVWKPINTLPGPPFLCSSSRSSLRLWPTVNRNNGEWLLGGQGAAGAANEAADESRDHTAVDAVNPPADRTDGKAGKYHEIQPGWRENLFPSCSRPLGGTPTGRCQDPGVPRPSSQTDEDPPSSSVCHGG